MEIPQASAFLHSVDLNQVIEMVRQGANGNLLEVESAERDIVRIFVE